MCTLDRARDSLCLSVCSMVVYIYIYINPAVAAGDLVTILPRCSFRSMARFLGIIQIAAAGNSVSIFLDKFVVICCLVVVVVVVYVTPASRYLTYPSLHAFCPFVSICLLLAYMKPANALNLKP